MRRRTLLTIASIVIAAALAFLAFHMTRPSVAFISSESFPDGYDLPRPGNILEYRMTGNAAKADVVLVAPDASVPEGVEAYLFGREAEDGEEPVAVLDIDDEAMWECAAEEGAVVLYERSTAYARDIAEHLESLGLGIEAVTYSGRISGANADQVRSEIEESGAATVLAITPSSSTSLLREEHPWRVVMDVRDAAAMETTRVDAAVSIDWDATIQSLLSGNAELSYGLIALE